MPFAGTADVAEFALHAHAFPAFARAGEIDKAHRIAPFIGLRPGDARDAHGNVRPRAFESAAGPGIGDLRTDCAVLFDQKRVELECGAFLLRRIGDETTLQKFRGAGWES